MKKSVKAISLLLSAITLLTACSGDNSGNPIIGTVAEDEIPSEPVSRKGEPQEDLEELKAQCPVQTFTGELGETIPISDVTYIKLSETEADDSNPNPMVCICILDFGYFTYADPLYKIGDNFTELDREWFSTDSEDKVKEYEEYCESKSKVYSITKGDKLENGLICTDARTMFDVYADGSSKLRGSEVYLSGELTLTGTIKHGKEGESIFGDALLFYPDHDNGKVPMDYRGGVPDNVESDSLYPIRERFVLRTGSEELPEEYASIIGDNEYTNVEVTIKDIHLSLASFKTDYGSDAVLVSMKAI